MVEHSIVKREVVSSILGTSRFAEFTARQKSLWSGGDVLSSIWNMSYSGLRILLYAKLAYLTRRILLTVFETVEKDKCNQYFI